MQVALNLTENVKAAPARVPIAHGQDIRLESVTALWDGAGASGAFLPALSMYSESGVLLSRTYPDGVTMAVGDTAEVTYIPLG